MTEEKLDALVAELAAAGKDVSREEAREAVRKVAEIILLAQEEFGPTLMPPGVSPETEDLLLPQVPQSPVQ